MSHAVSASHINYPSEHIKSDKRRMGRWIRKNRRAFPELGFSIRNIYSMSETIKTFKPLNHIKHN